MKITAWRVRNLPFRLKGLKQELMALSGIGFNSSLGIKVIRFDGTYNDLGIVCRKVVTTAGVTYLATAFTGTGEPENFNFHDCGTGTTAAAIGDTALETPYGGARATGTQSNPSAKVYRTVGTITFTSTLAITEHGILSASSVGTLWDRHVFAAINVVNGDSIEFTYNLTINDGG